MDELAAFSGAPCRINSKITVLQPTLGQIRDYGEQRYFGLVQAICATPADRKVELWDAMGKYWDSVDEYDLFVSTFGAIAKADTSILLGELDVGSFMPTTKPELRDVVLVNRDGVIIDRSIHALLTERIRAIHGLRKNMDTAYDDFTRDCMIEDDRDEMKAGDGKPYRSFLKPLILAAINCPEFKYRWDDVWTLPIGVFMDHIGQIQKHKSFAFTMQGVYSGCVDAKKLLKKDLTWIQA